MATVVHRLRIRSAERDAHSVESRVSARLGAADLAPAALPPGATLVVRRIAGLPPWRLDPRAVRPPAEWQSAMSERLDALLRRATRVRRGEAWEDGDAVLYLDDAEMLAAMAWDWMDGRLATEWRWQCLFPRAAVMDAMLSAWVERPHCVPAAIERLGAVGRAETFVARLPETIIEKLLQGIARAFALVEAQPLFEAVFRGEPLLTVVTTPGARRANNPVRVEARGAADAPAEPVDAGVVAADPLSSTSAPLSDPRRMLLLAIARAARRSPRPSGRALAARLRAELLASTTGQLPVRSAPTPAVPISAPALRKAPIAIPERAPKRFETSAGHDAAASPVSTDALAAVQPEAPAESPAAPARLARLSPVLDDATEFDTAFGGLFYLINLAVYLGYYGDFSTPDEPGIDLALWDFLAFTGRALIGKRLLEDPVWAFLESLGEGGEWDGLEDAMSRIRKWLAEAFRGQERPAELVIERAARVRLTDTRLDVFLSLDDLPIAVRLARLDRDPGWMPAAGRHIAFHFR